MWKSTFIALCFFTSSALASFPECKLTTLGGEYKGHINMTVSNITCQHWKDQTPWTHDFGKLSGESNYCRNPDDEPNGPWCYATIGSQRWQYCSIPFCYFSQPQKIVTMDAIRSCKFKDVEPKEAGLQTMNMGKAEDCPQKCLIDPFCVGFRDVEEVCIVLRGPNPRSVCQLKDIANHPNELL